MVHPKLHKINLHNVTHFSIPKPQGTDVRSSQLTPYCHISLPYIMKFVIDAKHPRSQSTLLHCAMCQHVECRLLILLFFLCHLLIVGAFVLHIAREGQVEWTTLVQVDRRTNSNSPHISFVSFHDVTCYTNFIVSHIHVNTTKLRNIMCTLVAASVILRSLECMF